MKMATPPRTPLPPPEECLEEEESSAARLAFGGKRVRFDPIVRVAMLPSEQRIDARKARKGLWKPGPIHDEIWDGDILDFRDVELSTEEFKQLMRKSSKRASLPRTLQKVRNIFAVATEKLSITTLGGRFGGVDVVSARARLSEDFDEEDREEIAANIANAPSTSDGKDREDSTSSSSKSIEQRSSGVRVSYIDYDANATAPATASRTPSPTNKASSHRVTRFEPSPPSEMSPSERYAMNIAAEAAGGVTKPGEGEVPASPQAPLHHMAQTKEDKELKLARRNSDASLLRTPSIRTEASTATVETDTSIKRQPSIGLNHEENGSSRATISRSAVEKNIAHQPKKELGLKTSIGLTVTFLLIIHIFVIRITLARVLAFVAFCIVVLFLFVEIVTAGKRPLKDSKPISTGSKTKPVKAHQ
jgi:hypothetical protein